MYFQWPPNKIQKASSATTRRQAADTRCVPKTRDLRRASPNMITVRNLARGAKCWHVPPDHQLILRGCASKRKMFHVECESHMSGIRWVYLSSNIFFNYFLPLSFCRKEQFCYCSYDFCNTVSRTSTSSSLLLGLLVFCLISWYILLVMWCC